MIDKDRPAPFDGGHALRRGVVGALALKGVAGDEVKDVGDGHALELGAEVGELLRLLRHGEGRVGWISSGERHFFGAERARRRQQERAREDVENMEFTS